ncbi:MAG: hypothetical protein AB8G05_19935 [Oligoflexales bacterium]
MRKFIFCLLGQLTLIGLSGKSMASEVIHINNKRKCVFMDSHQIKRLRENSEYKQHTQSLTFSRRAQSERETTEEYQVLKAKKKNLIASPLLWGADDLILSNLLGYLATPDDIMNIKVGLVGARLPKNAIRLFKRLSMVELQDGERNFKKRLVDLDSEEILKIKSFLNPELTAKYHLYSKRLQDVWDIEALESGRSFREPCYINLLMQLLEVKIKEFENKKWAEIVDSKIKGRQKRRIKIKHNYAILSTMFGFHDVARNAVNNVIGSHVVNEAGNSAWSLAASAIRVAGNRSISFSAKFDTIEATEAVAEKELERSTLNASWNAIYTIFSASNDSLPSGFAMEHPSHYLVSASQADKMATYHAAEKAILLYFIEHSDDWLEAIYQRIMKLRQIKAKYGRDIFGGLLD